MSKKNFSKRGFKKQNQKRVDNSTAQQSQVISLDKDNMNIIKRWFRWDRIVGLATIISAIVAVYMLWPKSELEKTKESILSSIDIIERTFKPNELPTQDSLFIQFQQKSLQLASLWKAIEETKSYKEYVDKGISTLQSVLIHDFARQEKYGEATSDFTKICMAIRTEEEMRGDSLFSILNYSRLTEIYESLNVKNDITNECRTNAINLLTEALDIKAKQKDPTEKIEEAMLEFEKMKENPKYYYFDKNLFEFIIETNQLYITHK